MISGQIRKKSEILNATTPRDKRKYCLKCKYHGWFGAMPRQVTLGEKVPESCIKDNLYCNRIAYKHESALKDRGNMQTYDSRGDGPGCLLFEEGEPAPVEDKFEPSENSAKWVRGLYV